LILADWHVTIHQQSHTYSISRDTVHSAVNGEDLFAMSTMNADKGTQRNKKMKYASMTSHYKNEWKQFVKCIVT